MPITLVPPTTAGFSISLNTPAATDGTYSLKMQPAADAHILRGLLKPLPGGNFTVTVKVSGSFGVNHNGLGIIFRDTAGKYIICTVKCLSLARGINNERWSDHTTFSSEILTGLGISQYPEWLQASFDSSNNDVTFSYSYTGDNWVSIGVNNYLATADAFGIGVAIANASIAPIAWYEHFAVV